MQASDLVQLGVLLVIHGRQFAAGDGWLSEHALREYWSASRSCCDRWLMALDRPARTAVRRQRKLAVVQEVLSSEILTRIWTALASERERREAQSHAGPVVQNVLAGHQDVRNRALAYLVAASERGWREAEWGNLWRLRCEAWTDLLLSHLWPDCAVDAWAFDTHRLRDFSHDHRARTESPFTRFEGGQLLRRLACSLSPAESRCDLAALRTRIAYSIAACLPAEWIDATGPFADLWLQRLRWIADDLHLWAERERAAPSSGSAAYT